MTLRVARRVAARALLGSLALAWTGCALALDPGLDVEQYAHTTWRLREGFVHGWIHALAQTPDGYLWLGTEFGLYRFDGVRVSEWLPPDGQSLPGRLVMNLVAGRDGRLWMAFGGGVASWGDGKLTVYPEFTGWQMYGLREGLDGTVWVTGINSHTRPVICSIRGAKVQCEGEDRQPGDWLGALYPDSAGRVWVAAKEGVWRWHPGPSEFFDVGGTFDTLQCMTEDEDGSLLVGTHHGIVRIKDGKVSPLPVALGPLEPRSIRMIRDRDGALWVGSGENGIAHLHRGRVDFYRKSDGLTSEYVGRLFEDREGNIWVTTSEGLDRFRELAIPTVSRNQGLSDSSAGSVFATRDGSVWITTALGLDRWRNGAFTRYRGSEPVEAAPTVANAGGRSEIHVAGLGNREGTLFEDRRGRLWIGVGTRVGYLENDRWTPVNAPAGYVDGIAEDPFGNIWIANRTQGLLRLSPDLRVSQWEWAKLGRDDFASRLAIDPKDGGIWLGFARGGIAHVVDGRVDARYSESDGLGKGRVYFMRVDPDGTLWVGGAGGLSRVRNGRIVTLDRDSGLPCSQLDWMIEDAADNVWIYTACGVVRVSRKEFDAWFADAERGDAARTFEGAVYSDADGVRSEESVSSFYPHVGRATDGRLWFAVSDGVAVIDPRRLARNTLAPPVHIESLRANRAPYEVGRTSGPLALPPLIRDLQIDYTALSLVAPEKMQFRYRLDGRDRSWQDVGTRREAYYSDLPPGEYRFRVIASNNDGVWNERGATLAFTIAPVFYQTRWFLAACVAAVLLLAWLLYAMRVRQLEMRAQLRLEERVAERERIARDLHDTFLQSVQGLILKFHAAMTRLPGDAPSRQLLEQALERADAVVIEGRNRVFDLRDAKLSAELPQALEDVAKEFAHIAQTGFRLTLQGAPRTLHPLVREEAFRIGAEALVNAFRHAQARHIDVEIEYSRRELSLRVTDDGRGFDVNSVGTATGDGHFGLTGIHERARRIGAQVQVSSRIGSGTAIELRVPGAMAYATLRPS